MGVNIVAVDQQSVAEWPVSLATAKQHLRIDHSEEDDLIQAYIDAAVDYARVRTNRSFSLTKYRLYLDCWQTRACLRHPPFRAITGVFYTDSNGVEQSLPTEQVQAKPYDLLGQVELIGSMPEASSGANSIYIEYVAGYGKYIALHQEGFPYSLPIVFGINWAPQRDRPNIDAPLIFDDQDTGNTASEMDLPSSIKQAILFQIAHFYENREAVAVGNMNEVPMTTNALLERHQVIGA